MRIWNADANPEGMGIHTEPISGLDLGVFPARRQSVTPGSYGIVPAFGLFADPVAVVTLRFQPWLLRDTPSVLISLAGADGAPLWTLAATSGGLVFEADGMRVMEASITPKRKVWYDLALRFDMHSGAFSLDIRSLDGQQTANSSGVLHWHPGTDAELYMAAAPGTDGMGGHLNGRLEDITVRAQAADGPIRAFWDFSVGIETTGIVDKGPAGLHGRLKNLPTRAVTGSLWDGTEMAFKHAPRHYAAIHFHEDDLYDCQWQTDLEIEIPEGMESGVYGVKLTQGSNEDIIPFYVLPPRGARNASICYLASTFTYMAYANHSRGNLDETMEQRIADWGTPRGADTYRGLGFSTYNFHPDGTGQCYSSRLRPMMTMRPGFLTFAIHEGSGLRHFPADGHLVEWFNQKKIDIDVITDEDLHREGHSLIEGYDAVVTGTHPEYHTAQTLDALTRYSRMGGNFCYLGGNGFYWRIAVSDAVPGVMEVRRAEGGIRAWATEAGEGYQALDGQYGGLWRRNGRAPQQVGAVGFSGQGLFEGSYYRRTAASHDPDVAWIFDGVDEELLGNYGFSGGGAAGFELDRADAALGTPEGTVVLARSEDHGPSFMCVPEEVLSHFATVTGEPPKDLVRAEIVYATLPGGGHIFTTGAITFCGSLPWNGFDNGVSTMLENVVRRFGGLDR